MQFDTWTKALAELPNPVPVTVTFPPVAGTTVELIEKVGTATKVKSSAVVSGLLP